MQNKTYQPLIIPKVGWVKKTLTEAFGELVAQPLETGFGITLGNSFRRILLGGVEGTAVTSVIIKGVNNEFSPLPGVVEDAMQLILNIKNIVVCSKNGTPGTMRLRVQGERTVRVADIEADDHLELINKDHVLGHVADGGELHIDFFVENGRGYRVAQWPSGKGLQDDHRIHLDAMFSPVRQVTFDVEKTRVGEDIDFDRLILRVHTNGAESPASVVQYAVAILRTQLEHFLVGAEIPFNEISAVSKSDTRQDTDIHQHGGFEQSFVEFLGKSIEDLDLSVRAQNCLISAGIRRVFHLVNLSKEEVLKIKNFGHKSLADVEEILKLHGLHLGMNIKESDLFPEGEEASKEVAASQTHGS